MLELKLENNTNCIYAHCEPFASCHPDRERSEGEGSCIAQDRLREESCIAQGKLRVAISTSPTNSINPTNPSNSANPLAGLLASLLCISYDYSH